MPTMKRRVIYMTDENWAAAARQAEIQDMTVSEYVRELIVGGRVTPESVRQEFERIAATRGPVFTSRPFTPAPKPGGR